MINSLFGVIILVKRTRKSMNVCAYALFFNED